jgi:hydroxymethylglutaryl-CoA lyase
MTSNSVSVRKVCCEMRPDVTITEVALRDGLQLEPTLLPTGVKLEFADLLVDSGFSEMEVGAFVHPSKVPSMADSGEVVSGLTALYPEQRFHALVFNLKGAQRAVSAGCRNVRFVVSASDSHSVANAGVPTHEALLRIHEAAVYLQEHSVRMEGTIATAFVCPFDGDTPTERVMDVVQTFLGLEVAVLHLADTIGAATPADIRAKVSALQQFAGSTPIGVHLHNTYGTASANTCEALRLGIRRFDAAVGGLGGCPFAPGAAGNIAADDLVHLLHREGLTTGIDPARLGAARDFLQIAVNHPLASALSRVGTVPAPVRSVA